MSKKKKVGQESNIEKAKRVARGIKNVHVGSGRITGGTQALTAIRETKNVADNFKAYKAAKQLGRTDDMNKAKQNIKQSLMRKHPLYQAIQGVKDIAEGIKDLINHDSWYSNLPLDGLVNANFGIKKGIPLAQNKVAGNTIGVPVAVGIDVLLVKPITHTKDWEQSIQILYNNIRAANSGSINYSMYDLEKYIINLRSLHAIYAMTKRAYQTLLSVDASDVSTPVSYFTAMGLDYLTFSSNAANLREFGDKFSLRINKLLPLKLDLIERVRWLFGGFFDDSDDAKATPYVFKSSLVPYCSSSDSEMKIKGFQATHTTTATGMTFADFISNAQEILDAVTTDPIYAIIAGDILKAFGENAIYPKDDWSNLGPTPQGFVEGVLTQIQNATAMGNNTVVNWDVSNTNFSECEISSTIPSTDLATYLNDIGQNRIINANKDYMTPAETLSATRLSVGFSVTGEKATVVACGTEVVKRFDYVYPWSDSDDYGGLDVSHMSTIDLLFVPTGPQNRNVYLWSAVDYGPCFPMSVGFYGSGSSSLSYFIFGQLLDANNYAIVNSDTLSSFHGYAAMSLLHTNRLLKQSNAIIID